MLEEGWFPNVTTGDPLLLYSRFFFGTTKGENKENKILLFKQKKVY